MSFRKDVQELADKLAQIKKSDSPLIHSEQVEIELRKALERSSFDHEIALRKYESRLEHWKNAKIEMTRAVAGFAQSAIRTLVLINGGALLALLTFLGRLADSQPALASQFSAPMIHFSFGLVASCMVAMVAYAVQFAYDARQKLLKPGVYLHYFAVILAVVSLGFFVCGIIQSYQNFASIPSS